MTLTVKRFFESNESNGRAIVAGHGEDEHMEAWLCRGHVIGWFALCFKDFDPVIWMRADRPLKDANAAYRRLIKNRYVKAVDKRMAEA
jgi:hypothetical protein